MKKVFFIALFLLFQIGYSQQITHIQYWFGNDFSGRVLHSVSANSNNQIMFDISVLDNGINELNTYFHCRFVDSNNNWSAIYSQEMTNTNDASTSLVKVEYWFDTDFANKTIADIATVLISNELDHQELDILWPENAQEIHYRFKSSYNKWSSIQSSDVATTIYQNNEIVKVEYWFGNDFANRLPPQSVAVNANNEIVLDFPFPDNGSNQLDTTVHYRFQDGIGNWSAIFSQNSDEIENRDNKIVEVEWWLNDGFADKTTIPVTQTGDAFLDLRDLTLDPAIENTIHVRYKDKMNRWSSIFSFFPTEPGITVLVHGFQPTGGSVNYTDGFYEMGVDILNRSGGGIIYKNNNETGELEFMSGFYNLNPNSEIVLVYDWKDLSWLTNSNYSGNGNLEAASDNLLATILSLSYKTGLTKEQILKKPKHIIAHSRGNILTLQLLHRLANYFPETKIEQFTLLDPHPATTFGDLQSEQEFSPKNLPCVEGIATGCTLTIGCGFADDSIKLKIPENVLQADNYYRTDGEYEGIGNLGSFDGLLVQGLGSFNRKINNNVLFNGSGFGLGGTHSGVNTWYKGTINTNITVLAEASLFNTPMQNTNNWYINGSLNMENNFLETENRMTTGFNRSRIGKGIPVADVNENEKISLIEMNIKLRDRYGLSPVDYPTGVSPHTVFGGYFDTNNYAGWSKNGGLSNNVNVENGKAKIPHDSAYPAELKHSLMYFAPNYDFLKINVYDALFCSIKVTFFNHGNVQLGEPLINSLNQANSEQFIPIPNELKGEVGTFQIEYISNNFGSFKVDEIKLVDAISTINLKINIEGYYDTTTHEMRPVKMNQGINSDTTIVDDLTVELVHPTTLVKVATSVVQLKTNGTAVCNFQSVSDGTYYVVVKHRNAIQTWSATPVTISESPIVYDFSDSANKAYGSNLVELETGVYGLYSGDINQDEVIDASDVPELDTDVVNSASGFLTTDLNGDGATDNSDIPFIDNNIMNSIFSIHP